MFTKNNELQRGFRFMENNHFLVLGIEDCIEEKTLEEMIRVINVCLENIKEYVNKENIETSEDFIYGIKVYIRNHVIEFLEM
jgi:hypothetical protein